MMLRLGRDHLAFPFQFEDRDQAAGHGQPRLQLAKWIVGVHGRQTASEADLLSIGALG